MDQCYHLHSAKTRHMHNHSRPDNEYEYNKAKSILLPNSWPQFGISNPSIGQEENTVEKHRTNLREHGTSGKRQREHHVILASSQDDDDYDCNGHRADDAMMDCDNDAEGPYKRRRFASAFTFDYDGRIIQEKQAQINQNTNESTTVEEYIEMNTSEQNKRVPPVEWWRKKRPSFTTTTEVPVHIDEKSIVEKEVSSSCSAMDTTVGDDETRCHICQKSFPLPIIPSVREVMPVNALLNYFSPLNKKQTSNGDVAMSTNNSHHHTTRPPSQDLTNSAACCACCDRPSCPECQRECQACQKSFCSFCSITIDDAITHCAMGNSSFCLDCYDRLQ